MCRYDVRLAKTLTHRCSVAVTGFDINSIDIRTCLDSRETKCLKGGWKRGDRTQTQTCPPSVRPRRRRCVPAAGTGRAANGRRMTRHTSDTGSWAPASAAHTAWPEASAQRHTHTHTGHVYNYVSTMITCFFVGMDKSIFVLNWVDRHFFTEADSILFVNLNIFK